MGGRQKQRERRRKQLAAAAQLQESKTEESPEDDDGAAWLQSVCERAGMRDITESAARRIYASIEALQDVGKIDTAVLEALQAERVANCEELADAVTDILLKLLSPDSVDNSECGESQGKCSPQEKEDETVMVMRMTENKGKKWKNRGRKTPAPGQKASHTVAGHYKARGHVSSMTLGIALTKLTKKAKPRTATDIDEIRWSESRKTAEKELQQHFEISSSWEQYYETMTEVGRALLAQEIQRKTQRIYDYRATKNFQRTKLKKVSIIM